MICGVSWVRSLHVSQKYFLSIMQENLKRAENLEWQVGGAKSEANNSLKSISNKILGAQTACKEGLKALQVQAITDGFNKLSAAMVANAPPVAEASTPAYPPVPLPTMPPGTPPAGSSASTYGLPGCASSYGLPTSNLLTPNASMINTPQTPARVPPTSMGSMARFQQLLLLPRLQGMSRSPLWCFWWLMNQAHSAVLQFRLLDTCRVTTLLRVAFSASSAALEKKKPFSELLTGVWVGVHSPRRWLSQAIARCLLTQVSLVYYIQRHLESGLVPFVTEAAK